MIDRDQLHRVTATMIRYRLAALGGHTPNRLADPQAWRRLDRHELADTLAAQILAGAAHLFDLHVVREAVDALRRARHRAAGHATAPTPVRYFPGPPSLTGACAALRAHADRLHLEPDRLPELAGRLVTDLLHLLTTHGHPTDDVVLGALDTLLAETTTTVGQEGGSRHG